jgi:hypothetical protein
MKIPRGTPWTAPTDPNTQHELTEEDTVDLDEPVEGAQPETFIEPGEEAPEENLSDSEETGRKKKKSDKKSMHTEAPDFSGDRTLANECLFLQDMGWWVIAAHAVPDGEIGRLWEIMKVR